MMMKMQNFEIDEQPSAGEDALAVPELPLWFDVCGDWVATVVVGALVVSYWRGTWVLLDAWTCDQPGTASLTAGNSFCFAADLPKIHFKSAWQTYLAGNLLLLAGLLAMSRKWWQPAKGQSMVTPGKAATRFAIIYTLGAGTVCIWHGIWYFLDYFLLPDHDPRANFWTSCLGGAGLCFALAAGNSLLAPPAIFLLDGPSRSAPPLAATILTSYRSIACATVEAERRNARDPVWIVAVDMLLSYLVLPWGVVGYWRGFWYLMDQSLWGFTTDPNELHWSIFYSAILGMTCLVMASEDIVQYIPTSSRRHPLRSKIINQTMGRVRTIILAVGAVNFWRTVWYVWDEWLGKTYVWSAALSHVLGVTGLTTMGCLCSIAAPPSTLGADAVANPDCADEPLFSNAPVPSEALHWFSLGRQPAGGPEVVPISEPSISLDSFAARLSRQSIAHVVMATRDDSLSSSHAILTKRHLLVRQRSQFFRSR